MELETDEMRLAALQMLGAVTVSSDGGDFYGIFDIGYADSLSAPVVEGAEPRLAIRTSDLTLARVRKGQYLSVSATRYRIVRIEPDGTGMSTVVLQAT